MPSGLFWITFVLVFFVRVSLWDHQPAAMPRKTRQSSPSTPPKVTISSQSQAHVVTLQAPEPFSFEPQRWLKWIQRFQRYRAASGLFNQAEEVQINSLIYIMGPEAESILLNFEDKQSYDDVVKGFEKYFLPRKNLIYERAKFNSRYQKPDEPVEEFITDLHHLIDSCGYPTSIQHELLRDRLVVGLLDSKLKVKLQLIDDLDLPKAINTIRSLSLVQEQMTNLERKQTAQQEVETVGAVQSSRNHQTQQKLQGTGHNSRNYQTSQSKPQGNFTTGCGFCGGRERHAKRQCPAGQIECHRCHLVGHFAKMCRSLPSTKYVQASEADNEPPDSAAWIGNIHTVTVADQGGRHMPAEVDRHRRIFIHQFGQSVNFLLDTGADRVSFPYRMVPFHCRKHIRKTQLPVCGPDGQRLPLVGTLFMTLVFDKITYECEAIVMTGLKVPLLSYNAIRHFKMFTIRNVSAGETNIVSWKSEFPDIFSKKIGQFQGTISLELDPTVKPYAQIVPRPISIPLLPKVKEEIDRLLAENIIRKVDEVTDWCSPIVCVAQGDKVRICGDYTKLNEALKRPYHPIPKVEYTLAKIKGAKYFSKIDATKSFYQVRLDPSSELLTTFICPFGRFAFTRLPFGVAPASEYFVQKFAAILDDIEGVVYHVDDILVFADNKEKHDAILRKVLARLQNAGITINQDKSEFGVQRVHFIGHVLTDAGISLDPARVSAIKAIREPTNKEEVHSFMGILQFAARFIPGKTDTLAPISNLLKSSVEFVWGPEQQKAFDLVKKLLEDAPTLSFFDHSQKIILSADASSYGLGACLFTEDSKGDRGIIAYASRTLTPTERRYAQIEREALALTWAASYFTTFIEGVHVVLETDHKPLCQILQTKHLDELSPRLARFRMRLMRFSYIVKYVPGKELIVPDYLSRHPQAATSSQPDELEAETAAHVSLIVQQGNVRPQFLETIRQAQTADSVCKLLSEYIVNGWPQDIPSSMKPYFQFRDDLTVAEGLILKGGRIFIPPPLRKTVLQFIHEGHFGVTKCRIRAKQSVWWIGLSNEIAQMVANCCKCIKERTNLKEPFLCDELPKRPWEFVCTDLFDYNKKKYLVIGDYYSKFIEVFQMNSTREENVIDKFLQCFSRYGLCSKVRSDNGPQFQTKFKKFLLSHNISHVTSSPHYSQSNGEAESFVKIAKNLLKKNDNMEIAMLAYRTTPMSCGYSPAELFMGRKLRTNLPTLERNLMPSAPNHQVVQNQQACDKEKQAAHYNRRHRTVILPSLKRGEKVWIKDIRQYGTVTEILPNRSYVVEAANGSSYRRNRWFLITATHAD